ncbi:MAG: hypothetical protein Kow0059_17650 [Candidatus Sumerlaeia bacterium]
MARKGSRDSLQALLEQVELINRLNTALSTSLKLEDIYSVILAALVARNGLGYSRAMIFRYDAAQKHFTGYRALGSLDDREAARMREEMQTEFEFISNAIKDLAPDPLDEDNVDYINTSLSHLQSSALWVTSVQKFGQNTPLNDLIASVTIDHPPGPGSRIRNCITEAVNAGMVMIFKKSPDAPKLPNPLYDILDSRFLVAPIRSKKQTLAAIIVDKKFEDKPITHTDRRYLEWFSNQAALVIENAEMLENLQAAYNDLKQMDHLKTNFLSIISHELRTPLTAILGFADLLINEKLGPVNQAQRELLDRIIKNSHHLTHVVNDLIEVTHIQAGETTHLVLEPVDPLNILMSIQPKLHLRRREKQVSIEPQITGSLPMILANAEALEKIFFHLLDNAIKFSPEGSVVKVAFSRHGDDLHISIIDQGIGIPQDRMQSIFELFYQVDDRLARTHEGLGLGLTLTKMLTSSTGGRLDVQSEAGKGSTFTIIYPVAAESCPRLRRQDQAAR